MTGFMEALEKFGVNESGEIAHYGKKGMKWGVHNTLKKLDAPARAAFLKERDAKWLAKVEADPKLSKVSRIAARGAKKMTKKLKQDYKDRGYNLNKDAVARSRYDNELKIVLEQSLDKASYKVHKTSPSRLNEVQIHRHPDGSITAVVAARTNAKIVKQFGQVAKSDARRAKAAAKASVSHAEEDVTDETFAGLEFLLISDSEGFVDDIITPFDSISHSDLEHDDFDDEELEDLEDTLMHYGVPGMKWGKRKNRAPAGPTDVEVKTVPGKRVQARGGAGQPAHPDAIERAAARQKARASTVDALSTQELKRLVERMNLEANYAKLAVEQPTRLAKGKKFALKLLSDEGQQLLRGKRGPVVGTVANILDSGYSGKHRKK